METGLCRIYVANVDSQRIVFREDKTEYDIQREWLKYIKSDNEWQTEEGHRVRILSPGHHNVYGGPDFKDALIEINGLAFRGDIEIHQKGGDWYYHGHNRDARYDRVLLHVVWSRDKNVVRAITSKGNIIPTLVLNRFSEDRQECIIEEKTQINKNSFFEIPPCLVHIQFDYEIFVWVLSQQRILNRIEQMRKRFYEVSLDELAYEFLFYSLGMGTKYASLYMKLAQHIPYSKARDILKEDPRILESILLHASGYLQKGVELKNPYALLLDEIRKEYKGDYPLVGNLQGDNLFPVGSVYPNANPASRMACMVSLLSKAGDSLSEYLYTIFERNTKGNSSWFIWEEFFRVYHYYWSYYNTWEMKRSRVPHILIGKERVYSILGNVLLPFFLFSIQEGLWGQREERIWEVYYQLPGESNHWLLKKMRFHAEFLFPRRPLKFFEQQALIQWYKTGCSLHPRCVDCPWNMMGNKADR